MEFMATPPSAAASRLPRSALKFDVTRLPRRPGSMLTLHETVPSPSRIGLELLAIEQGAPLELDLRFESVSEGILVTGTMSGPATGECSRCLTTVGETVDIDLTELFAYPDSTTDETTEADEIGRVVDNTIDLEQPIVDAVGLALPFAPLCRDDCPGLCPQCGVALAEAAPGHAHEQIDPRFAKLAGMFDDDAGSGE